MNRPDKKSSPYPTDVVTGRAVLDALAGPAAWQNEALRTFGRRRPRRDGGRSWLRLAGPEAARRSSGGWVALVRIQQMANA